MAVLDKLQGDLLTAYEDGNRLNPIHWINKTQRDILGALHLQIFADAVLVIWPELRCARDVEKLGSPDLAQGKRSSDSSASGGFGVTKPQSAADLDLAKSDASTSANGQAGADRIDPSTPVMPPVGTVCAQKKRGRRPEKRQSVEVAMRRAITEERHTKESLRDSTEDALAAEFRASRTTVRAARKAALS